jgi:hypothetical protein
MTLATRILLILTLMAALTAALAAQETTTATATSDRSSTAVTETSEATTTAASTSTAAEPSTTSTEKETERPANISSYEVRNQFVALLRQSPPELGQILKLDPTLMSNQTFLAGYPDLARFLDQAPEVRLNPRFYLAEVRVPGQGNHFLDEAFEWLAISVIWFLVLFAGSWLVRTVIEQRRWNRLSKTQSEVHNKILDRFGSSEEVIAYMKTPAGSKFLEAAPIPLTVDQGTPPQNAPLQRVLWSVQIGVVVGIASLGMLLVSVRFDQETGQGMFALGVIGFCVGLGFIAAGVVSMLLSRRFGLWPGSSAPQSPGLDDAGSMR